MALLSRGAAFTRMHWFKTEYGRRRLFLSVDAKRDDATPMPASAPWDDDHWYLEVTLSKSPRLNPANRWPDTFFEIDVRYVT